MKKYIAFICFTIIITLYTNILYAQTDTTQNFIREYYYNASEDDSRNSARQKALTQVKILLLEEVGVYVESYLDIETDATDDDKQYVRERINTITAGDIKTTILDEQYDGETYYVKASVIVDSENVEARINEILERKHEEDDRIAIIEQQISELNKQLEESKNNTAPIDDEIVFDNEFDDKIADSNENELQYNYDYSYNIDTKPVEKPKTSFYEKFANKKSNFYILGTVGFIPTYEISDNYWSSSASFSSENTATAGFGVGGLIGYWYKDISSAIELAFQYNWYHSGDFKDEDYDGEASGYDVKLYYLLQLELIDNYTYSIAPYIGIGVAYMAINAVVENHAENETEDVSVSTLGVPFKLGLKVFKSLFVFDGGFEVLAGDATSANIYLSFGVRF